MIPHEFREIVQAIKIRNLTHKTRAITMEIKSKKDIVKVIDEVKKYISGQDVTNIDFKKFMESDNSMVQFFERVTTLIEKDEFFNLVDVIDPENSKMWKEFHNIYTDMMKEFKEGEKEKSEER